MASSAGLIGLWPPWSLPSECTDSRPPSLGSGVRSPAASSEWLPACLALASATVPGLCSRTAKRGFGPLSFGNEGDRLRRELAPVSAGASPDEVTALEATSVASCSAEALPRGLELLVCCFVAADLACAFAPHDAPTWGMLRSTWRP
ncbi:hypothetical protein PI125_g26148 [Phytophthora idaei]|nr:hypothetical protein PI125_g26148 [Phytophthora idaei]